MKESQMATSDWINLLWVIGTAIVAILLLWVIPQWMEKVTREAEEESKEETFEDSEKKDG